MLRSCVNQPAALKWPNFVDNGLPYPQQWAEPLLGYGRGRLGKDSFQWRVGRLFQDSLIHSVVSVVWRGSYQVFWKDSHHEENPGQREWFLWELAFVRKGVQVAFVNCSCVAFHIQAPLHFLKGTAWSSAHVEGLTACIWLSPSLCLLPPAWPPLWVPSQQRCWCSQANGRFLSPQLNVGPWQPLSSCKTAWRSCFCCTANAMVLLLWECVITPLTRPPSAQIWSDVSVYGILLPCLSLLKIPALFSSQACSFFQVLHLEQWFHLFFQCPRPEKHLLRLIHSFICLLKDLLDPAPFQIAHRCWQWPPYWRNEH